MSSPLRHGAATDIGKARKANEDSLLVEPPLFAVADGMGGHSAGDVASQTAVAVLKQEMAGDGSLAAAVQEANKQVFERSEGDAALSGMGTTMTAVVTSGERIEIAHVGDSRAYMFRNGRLSRLTTDHTVMERLVRQGRLRPEEARHHPQRSVLERALGVDSDVQIDLQTIDARPGDRLLLCTDGLTAMLEESRIRQILDEEQDPSAAADRLVAEAVAAGGHDNVSVIVIDFPRDAGAAGLDDASPADTVVADEHPPIADPPGWSIPPPPPEPVGPPPPPAWSNPPPPPAWSDRPATPQGGYRPPGGPPPPVHPATSQPPGSAEQAADPSRRRRIIRRAVIGGLALAVLVVGGMLARSAVLNSWYVGASGGEVAIFRGLPGTIMGIRVSELQERTDIKVASLIEIEQERVREGKTAATRSEAQEIVRNLQRAPVAPPDAVPTAPPPGGTPSPEPSPSAPAT
jgi:protein phosphatase